MNIVAEKRLRMDGEKTVETSITSSDLSDDTWAAVVVHVDNGRAGFDGSYFVTNDDSGSISWELYRSLIETTDTSKDYVQQEDSDNSGLASGNSTDVNDLDVGGKTYLLRVNGPATLQLQVRA